MANRPLADPEGIDAYLPIPPDLSLTEGATVEEAILEISSILQALVKLVNGNLSLGDSTLSGRAGNINAQHIPWFFKAADTEYEIPHTLGRIPISVRTDLQDKAGSVYTSRFGSWGNDTIFLKASVADLTTTLLLF